MSAVGAVLSEHWAYWGTTYISLTCAYLGHRLDRWLEGP